MPKIIAQDEFDQIINAIKSHPQSSLDHLLTALPLFNKRTLQRRLALLENQGLISVEGASTARQYSIKQNSNHPESVQQISDHSEGLLFSTESQEICENIHRPLIHRTPVGYQRNFLDAYQPNHTFYLPESMRQELFELGKTPDVLTDAGTYVRKIYERLLIDLSWNSSRLEGNTYSLIETQALLNLDKITPGKSAEETQMLLNHKQAIEFLTQYADQIGFNRYTILNLHALLSDNLLGDPEACGNLRCTPVGIGKTVYHPLEIPALINEVFNQILNTAKEIQDPFEQSFFAMVHLPYLQPFLDVNKRVSRLAANISLIQKNLCPLSFINVPQQSYVDGIVSVYELNRIEPLREVYFWAYKQSSARYSAIRQSIGEPDLFRLQHREIMGLIIKSIIQNQLNKTQAVQYIKAQANLLDQTKRPRLIEIIEDELMCLHEGNIARYKITPSEYQAWQANWH